MNHETKGLTLRLMIEGETKGQALRLTFGGGTYAEMMPEPELALQKEEHISLENLMHCARIYALAMWGWPTRRLEGG